MTKPQRHGLEMILAAYPEPAYVSWRSTARREGRIEINGPICEALEKRGLVQFVTATDGSETVALTKRGIAALDDAPRTCEQSAFFSQQEEAEEALRVTQARRRNGGQRTIEKSIRWCGQHRGWHMSQRRPKAGGVISSGPKVASSTVKRELVDA